MKNLLGRWRPAVDERQEANMERYVSEITIDTKRIYLLLLQFFSFL